jgi:four helix bundle protein
MKGVRRITENVIETKSYNFAIDVINTYKKLQEDKEFILSKQFLRSGTSIGANVMEALRANSRKDFLFKMNIALKEANETEYWIKLLIDTGYLKGDSYIKLISDCKEICRILNAIVRSTRENNPDYIKEDEESYIDWSLIE